MTTNEIDAHWASLPNNMARQLGIFVGQSLSLTLGCSNKIHIDSKAELEIWQKIANFTKSMHCSKWSETWLGTDVFSKSPRWFLGAARLEEKNAVGEGSTVSAKASQHWALDPIPPTALGCRSSCVLSPRHHFSSLYWIIPISMRQTYSYFSHSPQNFLSLTHSFF